MKRVLVTGGNGFIGRNALAPLLQRGFEVHATSRNGPQPIEGVSWHQCDLLDAPAARSVLEAVRPSHLLHLAWYTEHGKYWSSPLNLDWVSATLDLFRSFHDCGGARITAAGTCAEYEWGTERCFEVKTPLKPKTLYGTCKNAVRAVGEQFSELNGLGFAWGRVFLAYGPYESIDRLVPSVARALLRGEPARCSPGDQQRDFLHVGDVAEAFVALTDSAANGSFNIASGDAVRIKDVVGTVAALAGRDDLVKLGAFPNRADDPPALVGDTQRLRDEIGWSPRRTLQDGLSDTVAWWRSELAAKQDEP